MQNVRIKTEAPSDAAWQQPPPTNVYIPERDPTRHISIEAYNNLPKSSNVNADALKNNSLRFAILKEIEEIPEVWKKEIAVNEELARVAIGVYSRTGKIFNVPTIRNVFTVAKQRLKGRVHRALRKPNVVPTPEELENILWDSYGADYGVFRFYRTRMQQIEQKWRSQLLTINTIVLSDDEEEEEAPADLGRRRSGGPLEAEDGPATNQEAENVVEQHAPEENYLEDHQPPAPAEEQNSQAELTIQNITTEATRVIQEHPARVGVVHFGVISFLQSIENARPEQMLSDVFNDLAQQWRIWEN